jgi:hypothetical protein
MDQFVENNRIIKRGSMRKSKLEADLTQNNSSTYSGDDNKNIINFVNVKNPALPSFH